MSVTEITLVRPSPDQLPLIRGYLAQLAQDEGVAYASADEAFLRRTLFGDSPVVTAHLAVRPGNGQADTPCGLAIHSWKWGAFSGTLDMYLHVLVVDAAHRGAGIGRAVLGRLLDIAGARGASRLELLTTAGNPAAAAFYDRLGVAPASHMVVRRKVCAAAGQP